ncbi:MAG TPA: hypothetical protein VFV38_01280 [Ktedonobacteraceae bacterium]|nr:hypothetical protein [Ktedonobacteraceae bacterium]
MTEMHALEMQSLNNHQLFSQAYLRERRGESFSHDTVGAEKQTMREWREAYPHLEDDISLRRYIGSCLSTLHLPYSSNASCFTLYADASKIKPIGICLAVNDTNLGCSIKGKHYQARLIKYLRDASLRWGIVTNGKHWRLCYAEASAPYEVFLEMDLDRLLEKPDLSEYYLFHLLFGQSAFTTVSQTPDNDSAEVRSGLDRHLKESEKRIETVQRYLRSRVEQILKALCLGFVQDEAAGSYTREVLDEVYRNSIYLLYRMLFLFYAESRELLPIQNVDYQHISFANIVEEARLQKQTGKEDPDAFSLWKRLTYLFVVVDDGDEAVEVRPYNGGLFSDKEKPYLKAHKIANVYLAPALYELAYMQGKTSITPIDYSDLSVRHLGTLYEGLLEYRLHLVEHEHVVVRDQKGKRTFLPISLAVPVKRSETVLEVGQAYFADYKGERKSSGSYYTPEDVVQYIVANTVLPILQKRRQEVETFLGQVQEEIAVAANKEEQKRLERYADEEIGKAVKRDLLSLRILDPAMGSAHFLVAAGQVVTNFIVETLNLTEWVNDSVDSDPFIWKRRVVERCLYGVDLNPLAHELAKLALWLNSASKGKPLTFLDHHLKIGNSLYSAPLNRLSTLPPAKKASTGDLWEMLREEARQHALTTLAEVTSKDSDEIQDVKRKGQAYREANDSLQRWKDIANVWLGTLFGLQNSSGKPVTDIEYQALLSEVTRNYASETWERLVNTTMTLHAARDLAHKDNQCFFHWELEFPDAVVDGRCQFHAIIANPPYVGTSSNQAISELYETARCGDLYAWLFEQSLCKAAGTGNVGLIIPLSLTFNRQMKPLRKLLLQENATLFISSFDATRDGIFLPNGESRNGQRASIAVYHKQNDKRHIHTTSLIRWLNEERSALFSNLNYTEITPLATEEAFPKLGDPRLVRFLQELRAYNHSVGSTIYHPPKRKPKEKNLPPPSLHYLYVPRFARYFITALPTAIRNRGLHVLGWEKEWIRDVAMVALNSNVFYWLWCVLGDGLDVTTDNIEAMAIPDVPENDLEVLRLRNTLLDITEECTTYHSKGGISIPNYNFNRRMDVLIDIDAWLVRSLAPNLILPRDIFAQYKSNSFLRPLDLSEIIQTEAEENLVMEVEE